MSDDEVIAAVDVFLAAQPYYPCCLLVHPDVLRLRHVAGVIGRRWGWHVLSIGTLLSEALLALDVERRPREVQRTLGDALSAHASGPVLCTDIDLLFEPALQLDPLPLVRDVSRGVRLVVMWPGTLTDGLLAYATPEHAHFRTWPRTELCTGCMVQL